MRKYRKYRNEIKEFARVRMEQTPNNTQIARDIKNKFSINEDVENLRWTVVKWRKSWKIKAKKLPIKRLFFDIETSYIQYRRWKFGGDKYVNPDMIIRDSEIICISYKWQHDDKVHTLDWRIGEKKMLKAFVKIMAEADEIIGHNGDRFDLKELRTRCIYHGVLMYPTYRTLDTLRKSRQYFNFSSNRLNYIGRFLNIGEKVDTGGIQLWIDVVENKSVKALENMIKYCERDVILLEDAYFVLSPFITHNNNFAVLTGGEKWECPECASSNVEMYRYYTTPLGVVRREMKCNSCKKQYKVSNKTYMDMLTSVVNRD